MKELFGSLLVAYSDSTGQYEALDTASLAQGQQVRVADVLAHRNSADSADAAADSADADSGADHSFSVAWGINRSLDTAERQGFVLIALVAGAGHDRFDHPVLQGPQTEEITSAREPRSRCCGAFLNGKRKI